MKTHDAPRDFIISQVTELFGVRDGSRKIPITLEVIENKLATSSELASFVDEASCSLFQAALIAKEQVYSSVFHF